jgi:hypothetical protein
MVADLLREHAAICERKAAAQTKRRKKGKPRTNPARSAAN